MQRRSRDGKTKVGVAATKERPPKLEPLKEGTTSSNDNTNKPASTKNDMSKESKPKIPRNVNFYRHLITEKVSSENEIEWVLKLRSPSSLGGNYKMEPTSVAGFSFGDRDLECQKNGRTYSDIEIKNKPFQVPHLYDKRLGPTVCMGSVQFECGLRDYGTSSDQMRTLEKKWNNIPKKDRITRNDSATMYPNYEETAKIKTWSTKNLSINTHSAFDGYQSYPKYEEISDQIPRNVQSIRHLLAAPGQLMSSASWQLSMRHYGGNPVKLVKQKPSGGDEGDVLGDLKKINRNPKRI